MTVLSKLTASFPQPRAAGEPIPFNRPELTGRELDYVRDAIARGHLSGDGVYTRR